MNDRAKHCLAILCVCINSHNNLCMHVHSRISRCAGEQGALCEFGCESQVAGGSTSQRQHSLEALSLSRYTSLLGNAVSPQNKHTSHLLLSLMGDSFRRHQKRPTHCIWHLGKSSDMIVFSNVKKSKNWRNSVRG